MLKLFINAYYYNNYNIAFMFTFYYSTLKSIIDQTFFSKLYNNYNNALLYFRLLHVFVK